MIRTETEYSRALNRLLEDRDFIAAQRTELTSMGLNPEEVARAMQKLLDAAGVRRRTTRSTSGGAPVRSAVRQRQADDKCRARLDAVINGDRATMGDNDLARDVQSETQPIAVIAL